MRLGHTHFHGPHLRPDELFMLGIALVAFGALSFMVLVTSSHPAALMIGLAVACIVGGGAFMARGYSLLHK
jgi:hypothetical protein